MRELSPRTIAALLGRPAPTDEQQAVITAPLAPGVVVAGAGSGKTETMAARVVWLVANGHVRPDEVLGLTFTRKAAGELAQRVRRRLSALQATGRVDIDGGEPTVSTYDAFAGRVVTEHGARLGVEPGRRLLSAAGAWQRAARLVRSWDEPMDDVVSAPDTVVADVLDLHEQAASHLADLDDVARLTDRLLATLDALPPGPRQRKPLHSRLQPVRSAQVARLRVLPIVRRYRSELDRDDLTDFATIAAQAAMVGRRFPEVGVDLRNQFRLVLLDEFQDTSYAQLDLLVSLFGAGHAVTAVGDPFQSIYAWRGASADTLASFAERFAPPPPSITGVPRQSLRVTFRNATRVLDVANAVAEPLRAGAHSVETLVAAPRATAGRVHVDLHHSKADQAQALADQVAQLWRSPASALDTSSPDPTAPPAIGVLVRKRDEMPLIEAALRDRGVPVEVVGLDGLLTVPEVSDTVALLQVAVDPARGDALMRLLTGARMRLGVRDIDALARWARRLSPVPDPDEPTWQSPRAGIVDCLDSPPPRGWLTEAATHRVRRLASIVSHVRERLSRPLPDVVLDAVHALGLDVETLARSMRLGGTGTAHLDRLVDEAAAFAELAPAATMAEFLDYLAAAAEQERGLRRAAEVHLGARVQLLTVHAAKGLEWDVVAVAGLTDTGFPSRSRTGAAWLTDAGTLPYPLRGDAAHLPVLDLTGVEHQSDLAGRVDEVVGHGREIDLDEERRLAYVALTRARHVLLCHGYRWGSGQTPLQPSAFLTEVAACPGVEIGIWLDDPGEPPDVASTAPLWPVDPLGRHRGALEDGARLVRSALALDADDRCTGALTGRAGEWAAEVELLLAERAEQRDRPRRVRLPQHLSATQLVAAGRDPQQFLDRLRRPMPVPPRVEARRGTAFHAWVEQRYGAARLLDLDELPGAADALDPPAVADLAELQAAFLASTWADRIPLEVEAPFETVVDSTVVRGRADAVFADGDGLVVVDWKTGPPPRTSAEREARSTQLAVYRHAFSALHGLPMHRVRAVFHHVRENVTIEQTDTDPTLVSSVVTSVTTHADVAPSEAQRQ